MLSFLIINSVEFFAAVAGIFYLRVYPEQLSIRYFVYFLWFTVLVEVFGWLPWAIDTLECFAFLENTFLADNFWEYNIYFIISYCFYIYFFASNLSNAKRKKNLNITAIVYGISTIVNLIFSEVYFESVSSFTFIIGSLLLFISVACYFFDLMKSNEILRFHRSMVFYIAIISLLFHLVVTPIAIYSKYFKLSNPEFVKVHMAIWDSANIFTYSCYTLGFIICSRKTKSY